MEGILDCYKTVHSGRVGATLAATNEDHNQRRKFIFIFTGINQGSNEYTSLQLI